MKPAEKTVLAYGWEYLLCEILGEVLSTYGWNVVLSPAQISEVTGVDLALVQAFQPMALAIEDVRRARAEYPAAKIVVAGGEISDTDLLQFIEAGAAAYVSAHQGLKDLLDSMHMVSQNRSPFSARTTQQILQSINRLAPPRYSAAHPSLSPREKEILCLVSKGLSNKQIADSLSITPNTVKNHVHNVLEKLNVRSRHEAARVEIRFRNQAPYSHVPQKANGP